MWSRFPKIPDALRHNDLYALSNDSTSFWISSQQPGGSVFPCAQSIVKDLFLFSTNSMIDLQHMPSTPGVHVITIQTNRTRISLHMLNVS